MLARPLRLVFALALATLVAGAVACGINPQPEPPGIEREDPTNGDGVDYDDGEDAATPGSEGAGNGDAGADGTPPEAGDDADAGDADTDADADADAGDASDADDDAGDGEPDPDDGGDHDILDASDDEG